MGGVTSSSPSPSPSSSCSVLTGLTFASKNSEIVVLTRCDQAYYSSVMPERICFPYCRELLLNKCHLDFVLEWVNQTVFPEVEVIYVYGPYNKTLLRKFDSHTWRLVISPNDDCFIPGIMKMTKRDYIKKLLGAYKLRQQDLDGK